MSDIPFPKNYFGNEKIISIADQKISAYRKRLIEFIKNLPRQAVILDAGCGNGKVLRFIELYRPDIVMYAIDISDVSVFLPPRTSFKIGSVEAVPDLYPEIKFDAIFCLHVIEHLAYPMQMITGFKNALKPGGLVYLETPNWIRIFLPFTHMFFWNDYTHVRPFSKFAMRKLFEEYGFSLVMLKAVASHNFFIKNQGLEKIKKQPLHANVSVQRGVFARLWGAFVRRLIYPIIKDTLVVVAKNQ